MPDIESKIKENYPLADLSTFKVGGPARYLIEVKKAKELLDILKWIEVNKVSYTILAGGSNVLISDQGYSGMVIKMSNTAINVHGQRLECEAGANLGSVVTKATSQSLSGIEWAAGIPGSIGGAVRGNAGAFGSSIDTAVENIEVLDTKNTRSLLLSRNECGFTYRHSRFKEETNLIIWRVILKLYPGISGEISKKINEYLEYRAKTQPKLPSAGCTFKNILYSDLLNSNKYIAKIAEEAGVVKGGKVSAGWLISQLDIAGKKIGGAKVSLEHCNFIVNAGKATASDIVMLISYIKQQIRDRFGVLLEEEVQYVE